MDVTIERDGDIMKSNINKESDTNRGGRIRRRVRGLMESKTGRAAGITSVAVPVLGLIINDLRKPNSVTRQLLDSVFNRFLKPKYEEVNVIDITDKVEVLEENNRNSTNG